MSSATLPSGSLNLESIAQSVRTTLLQPFTTTGIRLASLKDPSTYQNALSNLTRSRMSLRTFRKVMAAVLTVGILYKFNKLLNQRALNNWVTDKSWDWRREIVLVTGGCSGIGQLIVQKLAERNVKVVVFDVSDPRTPAGPTVSYYKVDITTSEAIKEAAQKVREEVGHPTVLVNNAGIGVTKTIFDATENSIRGTFNVNILAHFLLVREFVPHMAENNHGHIVTVASMASFLVHAGNVAYSCTKAAALAFHEGIGQELKSRSGAEKVRTTVVHPTWVRTPLTEGTLLRKKDFNEFVLEPSDVADAIVSQLYKGESAQLILPGRLSPISSLRGWPSWLQENLRNSVAQTLTDV